MAHCWEERGCDAEMQTWCPHSLTNDNCPPDCQYAACTRPTHVITSDLDLLFRTDIDRTANVKDVCSFCEFFLQHAPKLDAQKAGDGDALANAGEPAAAGAATDAGVSAVKDAGANAQAHHCKTQASIWRG